MPGAMEPSGYDLIGDVHGYAAELRALLETLGYREQDGCYRRPDRRVVFLGDFVDRGPEQREVVDLARAMVEAGRAHAVMGNHEYNAIAYHTPDGRGGHLRSHTAKNQRQHAVFLDAFRGDPDGLRDALAWFRTLPLWLDLGGVRVVHACWDPAWIGRIGAAQRGDARLGDALLHASATPGTWQFDAIETLLKGKEVAMPPGRHYLDKEDNPRHHVRVRWWDGDATDMRAAYLGPPSAATHIPEDPIGTDHLIDYGHGEPPVFLGHYWLEGDPEPLAPNIACLDYSVAKAGGKLVAYRWDGERRLDAAKFVSVARR